MDTRDPGRRPESFPPVEPGRRGYHAFQFREGGKAVNLDDVNIGKWWPAMVKGKIVGCIRGREDVQSAVKYVQATLRKGKVAAEDLDRMLIEVEQETVEPFLGAPWHGPERQRRFHALAEILRRN